MKFTKKHREILLIWLLSSLFCLQVSYATGTSIAISIGWIFTIILFMMSLYIGNKHIEKKHSHF
ncbi:hypothetical protein ACO11K_004056 [Bacillus cytotoxicus]